jgi:predicted ArsR family transcriptional regulator
MSGSDSPVVVQPRPPLAALQTVAQYRTLLSPVRFEVFEAMRFLAPCPIADVARCLGRPADGLYQHVRKLQRAGIVRAVGRAKVGRRTQTIYDLIADDIDFSHLRGQSAKRVISLAGKMFLSVGRRTLRDALRANAVEFEPEHRNLTILNNLTWLTREDYQALRRQFLDIIALMEASRRRREGDLYMVMNLACPVVRRSRR